MNGAAAALLEPTNPTFLLDLVARFLIWMGFQGLYFKIMKINYIKTLT